MSLRDHLNASRCILIVFLIVGLIFDFSTQADESLPDSTILLAGTASAVINPEPDSFIAGDQINRRFDGVFDDIFVKVVVFSNNIETLAIMSVDCIGLMHPTIKSIEDQMTTQLESLNLPIPVLIVSSTHTHSGPDVIGLWGPDRMTSGVDPAYMEMLVQTAASQVVEAVQNLVPVTVDWAETTYDGDWIQNISEPDIIDRTLTVMRVRNEAGQAIATLTNFACHPTILDGVHDKVSSDFPGGLYREMGAHYPDGVHLFLQGALGGWIQPVKGDRSFALADAYGRDLTQKAITALNTAQKLDTNDIQINRTSFTLPIENPNWQAMLDMGLVNRPYDGNELITEVVWFRIGEMHFVTHPGETAPHHSMATRALLPEGPCMVLGLTQDMLGYILTPAYYGEHPPAHAGYLTSMSLGPKTAPLMMEHIQQTVPKQ